MIKNIKIMVSHIKKGIYIVLISWGIAFIAMLLAYMLPVASMRQHAEESLSIFEAEGVSPTLIPGFQSTYLDTYTDMTMLNMALYDGEESVLDKAMKGFYYKYDESNIFDSGVRYLQGETGEQAVSYARYWHGWIIVLKPLLLCLNYAEIRMFNFIFQSVLVLILLIKMVGNEHTKPYIAPLFLALMVIMPLSTAMSMGLAILYYVMLISMILLIHFFEQLKSKDEIFLYFVAVGVITCFVDLVTYPLSTVGILLSLWIMLNHKYEKQYGYGWKLLGEAVWLAVGWCAGYLGMWMGKWLIGSLITDENILKDAVLMVLYRLSHGSGESGQYIEIHTGEILSRNIGVLCNPVYVIMFVCAVAVIWKKASRDNEHINLSKYELLLLFGTGCLPFIWYLCVGNHSYIHYWMTYKLLSVTAFAWGSFLISCIYKVKYIGATKHEWKDGKRKRIIL